MRPRPKEAQESPDSRWLVNIIRNETEARLTTQAVARRIATPSILARPPMISSSNSNALQVAVIGMGLMGMLHARILKSFRGVQLVGTVEIDEARRKAAAAELGVPGHGSLAEVMDRIDAVSVTLPDELHAEACCAALGAGKYVLVEKPLATTEADARKILDAQVAPDRLMVGHLLRFDLRLTELKRRIGAGDLGRVEFVKVH